MNELSDFWPFFTAFAALVAAGFGAPIPEEIPTIAAGVWVGSNPELGPLRWLILPVCYCGVLISDVMLYGIGRVAGKRILEWRWVKRIFPPAKWEETKENFARDGVKILLWVRWLPAIRSPMFLSAGILRLPFQRFVMADGIALVFGHGLLFFLAWWFGDSFKELVETAEQRVDHYKPVLIIAGLLIVAGFLLYHFLRQPVSTANPQEVPLLVAKVAATIDPALAPPLPEPKVEQRRPEEPVPEKEAEATAGPPAADCPGG